MRSFNGIMKEVLSKFWIYLYVLYRNDSKFSDRYASANSVDPDQTAPRGAV